MPKFPPIVWILLLGAGVFLGGRLLGDRAPESANPSNNSAQTATSGATSASGGASASNFKEVTTVPAGLFAYGGSTTWAPIRGEVDPTIQAVHPEFELRYTDPISGTPGSSTGIRMLLDRQLAFSQSSRPLKDEEYESAQTRGFALRQIPVAIDGIAIGVHPDLEIPGLTVAQLRQIYTGELTNWQQVGGPNLTIVPISRRPEDGGTVEFFIDNVLEKAEFSSAVRMAPTTTEALRTVATTPGSLYYASAPELVPQCTVKPIAIGRTSDALVPPYRGDLVPQSDCPARRNQLNAEAFKDGSYPISRSLFVIVKEGSDLETQAGIAYSELLLSQQGQDAVEAAGFVPIR